VSAATFYLIWSGGTGAALCDPPCPLVKPCLDICSMLRMPVEIPAGLHRGVGKKCVHTGLGSRRIEDELGFAVLLQDGIVVADHDRAIRISIRRDPHSKKKEISAKRKHCCRTQEQDDTKEDAPEAIPQIERLRHEARL